MNLFDLHCDTAYELYWQKQALTSNNLAISLDKYGLYGQKIQVFAIWSENKKTEQEVYQDFFKIYENLKAEIDKNADKAVLCINKEGLNQKDNRLKIIPAVEGSRLIGKDLSKLSRLREEGVRILTSAWKGNCKAGGAYDTEVGLTDFGYELLFECERLGIIADLSHLSEKGFYDVANKAKCPFIASHSNSASIYNHPRNLTDIQFRTIVKAGGIVGISLVGKHLSRKLEPENLKTNPILEEEILEIIGDHIEHYLSLGGEKQLAIGADFDGTEPIPGFENVSCLVKIANELKKRGIKEKTISDIFYQNAFDFFNKNL